MSSYYDPEMLEAPPSTCHRVVCYAWKTITFLFSHITLVTTVVAYCLAGAKMFVSLEQENEIAVKKNISKIRSNITDHLWNLTKYELLYLERQNFTDTTKVYLKDFEAELLRAMTKSGWNGNEAEDDIQWTLEGALFYSIIVITTIGYGHIAPKTDWGKVATVFYAVVGIPLMLLCLSNVGDILATSFRFLYWKLCCYVCTRPKKPRRTRSRTISRSSGARFARSRTASFRRSMRTSTRSTDSGFGLSEIAPSSYSDTDLSRYHDDYPRNPGRGVSIPRTRPSQQSRFSDSTVPSRKSQSVNRQPRGGSLDRRRAPKNLENTLEPIILANTPVLCNKYVVHPREPTVNHVPDGKAGKSLQRRASSPTQGRRAVSMPRTQHYLEPPREPSPVMSMDSLKTSARRKRRSPPYSPSPKIMSPMGFGGRQRYLDEPESDMDYYEDDYYGTGVIRTRPVPIWLCVLLVLSYIIAGMFLFHHWEGWDYVDAAYFCFITLTTIGFGDFVPSSNNPNRDARVSIGLCSLYLLFGISLLAMSFNLVQEEVLAHVRKVAKSLGIIKDEETEEEED